MSASAATQIRLVRWNGHGAGWKAPASHRFSEFRVYAESGSVQAWVEVHRDDTAIEALQYLEPWQAVAVGWGFFRAALLAVWQRR